MEATCPKCRSSDAKVVLESRDYLHGTPGIFSFSECQSCHFWYQKPFPTPETLDRAYVEDYAPHVHDSSGERSAYSDPGLLGYLKAEMQYPDLPAPASFWSRVPGIGRWFRYNAGAYLMPEFVKGGKVLDLGCANGGRLHRGGALAGWRQYRHVARPLVPQHADRQR